MAIYAYMRVSTETQADKGYGLDTQRSEIDKYASAHNLTISEYFVDAGISGAAKDVADEDEAISKRLALLDMLAVLQEGDSVIVLNTSRLWRSDATKYVIRRELMKSKVILTSIEQAGYDLYTTSRDPSAYLTNAIMEALDVYERMSIALKLARGRATKARRGDKPAGICPYGYKYADDRKSVDVDEEEASAVRFMFSEGQKGRSLQQITDDLNSRGSRTRKGNEWGKSSVRAILRNPFYIGELSHQGKPIKGNHEPLVSRVQFGKVSSQLDKRHR